jgi:hypothetical protein
LGVLELNQQYHAVGHAYYAAVIRRQTKMRLVEAAGVEPARTLEESVTYRQRYTTKTAKIARVAIRKYVIECAAPRARFVGRDVKPKSPVWMHPVNRKHAVRRLARLLTRWW